MSTDAPKVQVWAYEGGTWVRKGRIVMYETLGFEPRFLDAGTWQMSLPLTRQALTVTRDRLVTIDWRGTRTTWCVEGYEPYTDDDGAVLLDLSGPSALSILGRVLAWPNPTDRTLTQQPRDKVYTGPTETVLLSAIADNVRDRYGLNIVVPASQGRGTPITVRARFDKTLELVTTKAKPDRLGFDVNLVDTSPGRADLTVQVWQPADKTKRVRLTTRAGTLQSWRQKSEAPTGTIAVVGGAGSDADRIFRQVTTPESVAAAAAWGGHREVFVDGPSSYDAPELDQAGIEQLTEAAATDNLALVAADAEGCRAFTHYAVGDKATGAVLDTETVTDVLTAIKVDIGADGKTQVVPTFGDPNATQPATALAGIVAAQAKRLRTLEQRR